MIGDRVIVHIHVVKFGSRSVSQSVSATLGLLTGPRVTDTDDSRESPLRSAPFYIVSLEQSPDFGVWSQSATGDGLRLKGDVQQVTCNE